MNAKQITTGLSTASFFVFLFTTSFSQLVAAAESGPNENWTQVNLALTDHQVIPAYMTFAETAALLQEQSAVFCADLNAANLTNVQNAFHAAMDSWQAIQHVQFGPVTYFNWNFRLQYWPDNNGTGGRQLSALIAGNDNSVLSSENFARQSVGVQGFPALERLLFDDNVIGEMTESPYQCEVSQAIARNLAEIAAGIDARWREEFRTTVMNADERGFFESAEDATIDFMKALVESVRRIQQQKIENILGEDIASSRVRRAESWRSDRSIRNLKVNIQSLESYFNDNETGAALHTVLLSQDVAGINTHFAAVQNSLAILPDSMNVALETEEGFAGLQQVAVELDGLFEALEAALKNTDLYLGFNSLDGD